MGIAVVANALLVGGTTATVAANTNEGPLADAGLDQSVTTNTTVYLDATGSRDPDGAIEGYEWRLERPDGNYTTPDCESCARTSFVARGSGTYNATITVTDDDGATSSDTLRVQVDSTDGPTVTLSGPDEVAEGSVETFSVAVSAGTSELMAVTWRVDDQWENRTEVSGDSASVGHLHAFRNDGTSTIRVTVVDRLGRQQSATKNVIVREPTSPGGGAAPSSGGRDSDGEACSQYNRDDERYCNNDRMTVDSNGITISDADNDGTVKWAGVTFDQEFAENHDGVSYDSTDGIVKFENMEAYKKALGVDSVNIDPTAEVNKNISKSDDYKGQEESGSGDENNENNNPFPEPVGSERDKGNNQNNENNEDAESDSDESKPDPNTRSGRVTSGDGILVEI